MIKSYPELSFLSGIPGEIFRSSSDAHGFLTRHVVTARRQDVRNCPDAWDHEKDLESPSWEICSLRDWMDACVQRESNTRTNPQRIRFVVLFDV